MLLSWRDTVKGVIFAGLNFRVFSVGDHFAGLNCRGLGLRAKSRGYFHVSDSMLGKRGRKRKDQCGQVDCVYDAITSVTSTVLL